MTTNGTTGWTPVLTYDKYATVASAVRNYANIYGGSAGTSSTVNWADLVSYDPTGWTATDTPDPWAEYVRVEVDPRDGTQTVKVYGQNPEQEPEDPPMEMPQQLIYELESYGEEEPDES